METNLRQIGQFIRVERLPLSQNETIHAMQYLARVEFLYCGTLFAALRMSHSYFFEMPQSQDKNASFKMRFILQNVRVSHF